MVWPARFKTVCAPVACPLPPEGAKYRALARWGRPAAYVVFLVVLAGVCVQFQSRTMTVWQKGRQSDREYRAALAEYRSAPTEANRRKATQAAWQVMGVDRTRGAIPRWSKAVPDFWSGANIYQAMPGMGSGDPLTGAPLAGATPVPPQPEPVLGRSPEELLRGQVWLHPNMPFVVILLTPLAYLPLPAMVVVINLLKIVVLLGSIWALADLTRHGRSRLADWIMGLAVLFVLMMVVSDFQHGNTNTFVLGALVAHLWLYRRGRDGWAGAALALAICLKMTPALFGAYWLYQRNWRLLSGLAVGLAVMVVLIPLAALGPGRYDALMGTWLSNLIIPGLLKGAPYPIHINQSLSGVFTRLFMHGNIYFNPDDVAVADKFGYVNFVALSPAAGKFILLAIKLALAGVMAWAIGWQRLQRDDGRRGLHYGLVAAAMLILNQRTWDQHAAILLIALPAVWHAVAYGGVSRRLRAGAAAAVILAGSVGWLTREGVFIVFAGKRAGKALADIVDAYGPSLAQFLILFVVIVALLAAFRRAERRGSQPYALSAQSS